MSKTEQLVGLRPPIHRGRWVCFVSFSPAPSISLGEFDEHSYLHLGFMWRVSMLQKACQLNSPTYGGLLSRYFFQKKNCPSHTESHATRPHRPLPTTFQYPIHQSFTVKGFLCSTAFRYCTVHISTVSSLTFTNIFVRTYSHSHSIQVTETLYD